MPRRKRKPGRKSVRYTGKGTRPTVEGLLPFGMTYRQMVALEKEAKRKNPLTVGLPRNKWVNARLRVTSGGKIQATVDENILGNLFGNKKKNTRKRKRTTRRKR